MVNWILAVLGTQAVVMALNLVNGVLAARIMGPVMKGLFNAVVIWPSVFFGLTAMGLAAAFTSTYARTTLQNRRHTFNVALGLSLFWGVVGAALCIALAPRFLGHLGPSVQRWVTIGSVIPIPTNAVFVATSLLSIDEAFGWLNWMNLVRNATVTLCLIILAVMGALNPYTQLSVTWSTSFLSSMPVLVAALQRARRLPHPPKTPRQVLQTTGAMTALGLGYYAIGLASMFNGQLDQMLASAWLSARDIGLYAVAASAISVVGIASGAFGAVFFPMVAADSATDVRRRTAVAFRRGLLVFVVAEASVALLARPLLWMLYGPAYLGAWRAVAALAPEGLFAAAIGILYQGCYALREFWIPAAGEIVGAVSGAGLLALLIPRWGILGAGVAGSVSYALDLGVVMWMWVTRYTDNAADLMPHIPDVVAVMQLSFQQLRRIHTRLGKVVGAFGGG